MCLGTLTDTFSVLCWELGSAVVEFLKPSACQNGILQSYTKMFSIQKSTGSSPAFPSPPWPFQTNLVTQYSRMGLSQHPKRMGGIQWNSHPFTGHLRSPWAPQGRNNRGPCRPLLSWLPALLRCNWWMLGWNVGQLQVLEALCSSIPVVYYIQI